MIKLKVKKIFILIEATMNSQMKQTIKGLINDL